MTDEVQVHELVSYKRWQSPNFANRALPPGNRGDGFKELPGTPVSELSQDAIDLLADTWLRELYAKAEKTMPWAKQVSA